MNVIELRASITDLSGEVQKLKKKLASALRFPENEEYAQKMKKFELSTEEIKLFKKLFGVHMSKYPPINMPEDEINFNDSVKMLLGMVCNYTSGLEHESSMRDVHFFNQIPQLLDLLTKINSTNSNVDIFINAWKNKLEDMNLRILVDHKEIQLRMLRQLMKHIRLTYTKFHTKLCLLIGFKDVEMCNEFKKSLEMISMHQSKANHPNSGESPTSEDTGKKQPTGKPPNIKINKQAKQIRKNVKDDVIPDEEERCIEDRDVHHKQRIKLKNMKKNNPDKKCSEGPDNEQINSFNPKHMEEELGMSNDLKSGSRNNDQINSFSSFSNAKEVETETGCPEKTKEEGWERQKEMLTGQQSSDAAEGSWFLDIGNQRSKLRTSESLSDWLFERARYRSTHKP